ncbi:AIG2-like protein D [Sesamum alatum]|uniref:Putative gamma-glutamylcyclotransferase n=1 Tax=Sesamum alatum TaxID=300844 RepID=A0AAE1YT36_9LAMI|nr:AIG2-like protein D [Sesamum alatum]
MGSASAANPAAISNVFVYGSLLADDVVRALLTRVPPSSPAILHDYHRFSIKGRVYPAILPAENKKVIGKVLIGITPPELHILDEFEDNEYERKTIDVFLQDTAEKLQAYTYVWENKTDPKLHGEWDFEEWKVLHMDYFLKMTKGFKEEMNLPDSNTRVATYETFYEAKDRE